MKVVGWNSAAATAPTVPAAANPEHGSFQDLMQRLEHAMWSGAAAGPLGGGGQTERKRQVPGGPAAACSFPWRTAPAPPMRTTCASQPHTRAVQPGGVRSAASSLGASPVLSRTNGGDVLISPPWAPSVTPPGQRSQYAAASSDRARTTDPMALPVPTHEGAPAGDRLQLLMGAGGLSVAVRLRDDGPLDRELLKRAVARILSEPFVRATLYLDGSTKPTYYLNGELHGD